MVGSCSVKTLALPKRRSPTCAANCASRALLIVAGIGLLAAAGAGVLLVGTAPNPEEPPSPGRPTVSPQPQSSASGSASTPGSTAPASIGPDATPSAYSGPALTGVFDSCLPGCDLYAVWSPGGEPLNLTGNGEEQHAEEDRERVVAQPETHQR